VENPGIAVYEGAQFTSKLTGIKKNTKFWSKKLGETRGLKQPVDETKKEHGVKSISGYWDGMKPSSARMEPYEPALAYPMKSLWVHGQSAGHRHGLPLHARSRPRAPVQGPENFYDEL
jgi:raffinose synthase